MRLGQEIIFGKRGVAARHAHQAHRVHRDEDRIDADERRPEMYVAELLIHHAPEHLGKPEIDAREHAEDGGHAHHQMEVSEHEVGVVHREIERRLTEHKSGDAARDEERDEADGKEHRHGEAYACAPERAQPVEGLDGRGHADGKRQHRERHGRARVHAADEHVMSPDEEAQEADGEHREDHRAIAEDGFAGERRKYVRCSAHARQDSNVNFRVAEEPE